MKKETRAAAAAALVNTPLNPFVEKQTESGANNENTTFLPNNF